MFFRRHLLEGLTHNPEVHRMIRTVCGTSDIRSFKFTDNLCPNSPYRQIDGRCNNVRSLEWGANYAPFQRFLLPDYADG